MRGKGFLHLLLWSLLSSFLCPCCVHVSVSLFFFGPGLSCSLSLSFLQFPFRSLRVYKYTPNGPRPSLIPLDCVGCRVAHTASDGVLCSFSRCACTCTLLASLHCQLLHAAPSLKRTREGNSVPTAARAHLCSERSVLTWMHIHLRCECGREKAK